MTNTICVGGFCAWNFNWSQLCVGQRKEEDELLYYSSLRAQLDKVILYHYYLAVSNFLKLFSQQKLMSDKMQNWGNVWKSPLFEYPK